MPACPKPPVSPPPAKPRRVKRVNKARKQREFARAYGSKQRVAWIAQRPCLICGFVILPKSENVHVVGGGTGRKADARFIVSMCALHHRLLHQHGIAWFESLHGCDLILIAAETEAEWQAFSASKSHISLREGRAT